MQRLNPPDPTSYNTDQKRIAASISGTRGSIRGPFGPWLHAPGFADPAQGVGAFLRYGSKMPANLRELAICTVGQHWQANYEWFAHAPIAIEEGVSAEAIELLRNGKKPAPLTDDEQLVHDLATEIVNSGRLSEASYKRGTDALSDELMVELVGLCGYYTLISFTLNVFEVPVPEGDEPPFGG
jgi:4-carboxymuconolactone decarboxylase